MSDAAEQTEAGTPASAGKPAKQDGKKTAWKQFSAWVRWRFDATPLSLKLVSILLILLVAGLFVVGMTTRQLMWSYMVGRTDDQLTQQAQLVLDNVNSLSQSNGPLPTNYFLQIRNADNDIVSTPLVPVMRDGSVSVPKLPDNGKAGTLQIGVPTTLQATVLQKGSAYGSRVIARAPWRVVKLHWVRQASGQTGCLYIGLSLSDAMDTVATITHYFLVVGVAIIVLALLIGSLIIARTLSPLKSIEKTAAKIAAGDLSQRLPSLPENTEVGSLSASLNTMLGKIEESFQEKEAINAKMKRFVSDASHELRTPLAAIHGYAELYRMQRQESSALERADSTISRIEASSTRMTALVNDLLSLARLDEGRGTDVTQQVRMDAMLGDSGEDLHALDPVRPVRYGTLRFAKGAARALGGKTPTALSSITEFVEGPLPKIQTFGDPARLRQVFTNIVGNIHRYTPDDSPVEIALVVVYAAMPYDIAGQLKATTESFQRFVLSIDVSSSGKKSQPYILARFVDHGPGVKPGALDLLFERFYTADASRAREKGGTGLGMAIAKSVMSAHSGFISASDTPGGGLTVNVVMPLRSRPAVAVSSEYATGSDAGTVERAERPESLE